MKKRDKFQTPYSQYKNRIGESFKIIRQLNDKDGIDKEIIGELYKIKFNDGIIIDAWSEEIFENC